MNKYESIIKLITRKIEDINTKINNIHIENDDKIKLIIDQISPNLNQNNYNYLTNLNINSMKEILPKIFEKDIEYLAIYQITASNSFKDSLQESRISNDIHDILTKILEYLTKLKEENNKKRDEIIEYGNEKKELEELKTRLSKNDITKEDIEYIISILDNHEDRIEALELLISFTNDIINKDIKDDKKAQTIKENENPEEIKLELIRIFKKHNLEFNNLKQEDQKTLALYGNPENINGILNAFDLYDINLNAILNLKSTALTNIFQFSKEKGIKEVLEVAKNNKFFDKNDKIDILSLLERPSRFIYRKKRNYRRGTGTTIDINGGNEIGCQEDFIKNIEFFAKLGINMQTLCSKEALGELSKGKTIAEKPHEHIKRNKEAFDDYGIPKEIYLSKLSCFYPANPADIIDKYIELGLYDYIVNNISKVNISPEETIFYKLAYALKNTDVNQEMLLTPMKRLREKRYLDMHPVIRSMTDENKKNIVDYYEPLSEYENYEQIKETFDEVLKKRGTSNKVITTAKNDDIISKLDENYLDKDENNKPIEPKIYNFGTIVAPNGKEFNINISRNKVKRIYNTLVNYNKVDENNKELAIIYSITKNSILTKEEYDVICSSLKSLKERSK